MFEYPFGLKKTLLKSLRTQKALERLDFGKTTYNDFVLARSEILRIIRSSNESLRLIIIYYMFKYTFWIGTNLLESVRNQKSPLKA